MIPQPSHARIDRLACELREGSLSDGQSAQLQTLIAEDAEARRRLVEHAFLQAMLEQELGTSAAFVPDRRRSMSTEIRPSARGWRNRAIGLAAGLVLATAVWFAVQARRGTPVAPKKPGVAMADAEVRFEALDRAKFFARATPALGTAATKDREYVLDRGMVRLRFPDGATATLEGPAVFRILTEDKLALANGRCSVFVPSGAEGFSVETPEVRLVDRGTRFAVRVDATVGTEVHTVDGAVDVVAHGDAPQEAPGPQTKRLLAGNAMRFWRREALQAETVPFLHGVFRERLADRIVSYEQSTDPHGHAGRLTALRVQRGGVVQKIPADRLILADLTWFKSDRLKQGLGHLIGPGAVPSDSTHFLSDLLLSTGVNNPGGSKTPLVAAPNMRPGDPDGTAGFAMQFRKPVMNQPGPDVVFFEIQTAGQPPEGDRFHVSPLPFVVGRRTHTVAEYDLTMRSSEALSVGHLHVFFFDGPVASVDRLRSPGQARKRQGRFGPYRVLAVGIDLSDLGVAPGEHVSGLFIQDAMDDGHRVDPVLIAGLPGSEK